jgi:hypothetical protein
VTIGNESISPENLIEGYLWRANYTLHDNTFLMGTYAAIDVNYRQRGVLLYHSSIQSVHDRTMGWLQLRC